MKSGIGNAFLNSVISQDKQKCCDLKQKWCDLERMRFKAKNTVIRE